MVAKQILGFALALDRAALRADAEARAVQLGTSNLHRRCIGRLLAKVHLAKVHLVQKLEAERELRLGYHIGLMHRIGRAVHQCLAHVEAALALV
ncbi:hypothetical protein D3C85_1667850 [compost metagenome]